VTGKLAMVPRLTRRQTILAALAAAALPGLAYAQADPRVGERTIGAPDAPVTLVEYAMFTCPHCANFHETVFPRIKENYIDTGKVRLVYREVYFNRPSLWAGMIARCAPAERYFGIVDVLFERQADWAAAENEQEMIGKLFSIGRQAGLTDDQMNACLQDRELAEGLVADYQAKATADKVEATPTFFINGEMQSNASYEELAAKLDEALGA
jgi:protein-disulfide isomerase